MRVSVRVEEGARRRSLTYEVIYVLTMGLKLFTADAQIGACLNVRARICVFIRRKQWR